MYHVLSMTKQCTVIPVQCHSAQERTKTQQCASSQNKWNQKYSCTTDSRGFQDSSQKGSLYIPAWLETSELLHPQLLLQLLPRLVPQQGVLPAVPTVPLCKCLPHSNPQMTTATPFSLCWIIITVISYRGPADARYLLGVS